MQPEQNAQTWFQPGQEGPAQMQQPGGPWHEQAGQNLPPADDQWAGAMTSSAQAATPPLAGASWQAQAASVAPSSSLWQTPGQAASPSSGGPWQQTAAIGREQQVTAPAGGLWQQTQSTGQQLADGQWQQAAPDGGHWQQPQSVGPAGEQWQQAQAPASTGGHWQHGQATATAAAQWQQAQALTPGGGQWQQAQTAATAGGLSQSQAHPLGPPGGLRQAQMTTQEAPAPSGLLPGNGTNPAPATPQAAYPGQQAQAVYPGQEASGPWGVQPQPGEAQPWMVQFNSQPVIAPMRRRGPWKAVVIGIVALAAVVGGGAAGVNAYAKHTVCSTLKGESPGAAQSGSTDDGAPSAAELAEMRKDADTLRTYGHMLVFSGGLQEAVNGLADDEDQMVDLVKSATAAGNSDDATAKKELTQLVTIVGSVNSHAREAQRACGLPVIGIFND